MSNYNTSQKTPINDNRYLNELALASMIRRALAESGGRYGRDQDLIQYLAWNLSLQIPSDVVIERARHLTVDELMESYHMQDPQLGEEPDIPLDSNIPADSAPSIFTIDNAIWGSAILWAIIATIILLS
ncbi:hypothetical protein [Halalkalibaculum sp. DA384]|uniref:hypothetical protein n=1 Tax=Halalkalibaculum sp. DA384 TaxID=3373606 RepID=UPI00375412D7